MNDWLLDLPVWAMALLILAITNLAAGGIFALTMTLAKGERARAFKSVPGSLLSVADDGETIRLLENRSADVGRRIEIGPYFGPEQPRADRCAT